MSEFEYTVANEFDRAWLNFELDLPLKPRPNGEPNPFYINRPGNPIAELTDATLSEVNRSAETYGEVLSGVRGLIPISSRNRWPPVDFSPLDFVRVITRRSLVRVIPTFKEVYSGFGAKLPAPTEFMIGLSELVQHYLLYLIVLAGLGIWGWLYFIKTKQGLNTLAMLAALYRTDEMRGHMQRALDNGVTETELKGLITHVAFYAGWPCAVNAGRIAIDVFGPK